MIYWNEKFSQSVERKTITENKNPMVAKERQNKMKNNAFTKCDNKKSRFIKKQEASGLLKSFESKASLV